MIFMAVKIIIEVTTERKGLRLQVNQKIVGENGNPYELTLAKDIYKRLIGLIEDTKKMLNKYDIIDKEYLSTNTQLKQVACSSKRRRINSGSADCDSVID